MNIVIENTSKRKCKEIVEKYHAYMDKAQHNASVDHEIFLKENGEKKSVGIIQYGYLACSSPIAGVKPENTISLSRIALSNNKKNLATASMSKSIGKMKHEYARDKGIKLLVSYSRTDFEGTIYKAYGFEKDGISKGKKSIGTNMVGNKPKKDIYTKDKIRWIFWL
ncbi:MAG: hypothetical protein ACLFUH_01120 [Bacteroidales bacterium]